MFTYFEHQPNRSQFLQIVKPAGFRRPDVRFRRKKTGF